MAYYIKEYPRPQFVRNSWENLNGIWDFAFDDQGQGIRDRWYDCYSGSRIFGKQEICVPFTYETPASGIGDDRHHPTVWYHRVITIESDERVILHFEGCDYETQVWLNGQHIGRHEGGYTRFSFELTGQVQAGENHLVVMARDSMDRTQMRGKQRFKEKSFECWYTQTTGIWKTVWLEYVPKVHLREVKMTPRLKDKCLNLEWAVDSGDQVLEDYTLKMEVTFEGQPLTCPQVDIRQSSGRISLDIFSEEICNWGIMEWSPQRPSLYDICFYIMRQGELVDQVRSYFAMRSIEVRGKDVLLNGAPLYQKLVLDQGYWDESHLTPPDEEALIHDIDTVIEMGFNGVRKHQKTEDERFFYWADVKGLLTWVEAPSAYYYNDHLVQKVTCEWMDIVRQYYNHPSVIIWVTANESWGIPAVRSDWQQQSFATALYYLTKSFDRQRPVISNDGWEHTVSDILTIHDYQGDPEKLSSHYLQKKDGILANEVSFNDWKYAYANGWAYDGQPIIISEYGGIALTTKDPEKWGYGQGAKDRQALLKRIRDITLAVKRIPYVCGYCYTQLTDVQQEVNGLMDARRQMKVEAKEMRQINEEA